jgi:phenylpropionate dioxygenase-like ring-hydroxylating dioxygenase large terminal subunit
MAISAEALERLIDDRVGEQIFRVHRDIFTDPAIFDLEIERIFEQTWNYVGHESQMSAPNDFLTTFVGRQPVLLMRGIKGDVAAFLNSCRHRGTLLCPIKSGNKRAHSCPYHGWTYDSSGRCVGIPQQREGRYPEAFAQEDHNLIPVARFGSYRGFLFAALSSDVPPLEEYLGEARYFLDMIVDQSRDGLEFVPGAVAYTYDGNWKTQIENGIDMYHFQSTHLSYIELMAERLKQAGAARSGPPRGEHGTFGFPYGHGVMWSHRDGIEGIRSFDEDSSRLERYAERAGPQRAKWMLYNRNLHLFPNVQIIDIQSHVQTIDTPSLQVRVLRPLAPDRTEMTSYCLAIKGESAEARRQRLRQYEDFFNASGLATPDDNVMFENAQQGFSARAAGTTMGYLRGLGAYGDNAAANRSGELGIQTHGAAGPFSFGDETGFHGIYREWRRLMRATLT